MVLKMNQPVLKPCSETVTFGQAGDVAILLIDNPPVNGLGDTVRAGLYRGIELAESDPAIKAIVISGKGKMFSGGADIRQFNTPKANAKPMLREVRQCLFQCFRLPVAPWVL